MAKRPTTLAAIYKKILEQKLTERQIAWIRKMGGLQLAVFGNPLIQITDESISIGIISGTKYSSKRAYHTLEFSHGDISNPDCDPEVTIEKILSIADTFKTLMASATNTEQIRMMCCVNVPSGTAMSLVKQACQDRGFPNPLVESDSNMIKVWLGGIKNPIVAGKKKYQSYDFCIKDLHKDGTGAVFTYQLFTRTANIQPLGEVLDEAITKSIKNPSRPVN